MIIAAMLLRECELVVTSVKNGTQVKSRRLFPQPSTAAFQLAKFSACRAKYQALDVEEKSRGGVQPLERRSCGGLGVSMRWLDRVMLERLGRARVQRETDVVRSGRPLIRPDPNQIADERGFQ